MSGALVSVVVPVHDGERYLGEALKSVLDQPYDPIEVVVVDDGSTDGSAALAAAFGSRVHVHSQPAGGIGAARNRGLAEARGEFIAFIDSDDLWPANSLPARLAAFDAEPSPDLVFGHVRQFVSPDIDPEAAARIRCPEGLQPGYLAGALIARREAVEAMGSFRQDLHVGEFLDWIAKGRDRGLVEAMVGDHVLSRRLHETNQSVLHRSEMRDFARVMKESLDRRRAKDGSSA
jgi:glycosyltransferase involved in cell wall biosynthesis